MQLDELFPTKYLKGEDLGAKGRYVTLLSVAIEAMQATSFAPAATKPVLYVQEYVKGIVLSRALANKIASIIGDEDTDHWVGQRIYLYPVLVDNGDHPHLVIRAAPPLIRGADSGPADQAGLDPACATA